LDRTAGHGFWVAKQELELALKHILIIVTKNYDIIQHILTLFTSIANATNMVQNVIVSWSQINPLNKKFHTDLN
jgi:hypothetical protein